MIKKRKRAFLILCTVPLVLTVGIVLNSNNFRNKDNVFNRIQCIFFNKNTIKISATEIKMEDIIIKSVEDNKVVFKDGKMISNIKNQYGGDNFKIFYNDKFLGQAGIFKTNWWHTHDFYFHILKTKSKIKFDFKVEGPNRKSLYFNHYQIDSLQRRSSEIFYNSKGKTGQININHFDKQGNLIADETWHNGIFVNMNTYSNGKFLKNYPTNKYSNTERYKLAKLNYHDSIVYIYQIVKGDTITNERIAIKN